MAGDLEGGIARPSGRSHRSLFPARNPKKACCRQLGVRPLALVYRAIVAAEPNIGACRPVLQGFALQSKRSAADDERSAALQRPLGEVRARFRAPTLGGRRLCRRGRGGGKSMYSSGKGIPFCPR